MHYRTLISKLSLYALSKTILKEKNIKKRSKKRLEKRYIIFFFPFFYKNKPIEKYIYKNNNKT